MTNEKRQLIVKVRHGSHLYGLNTPESDTDYKCVVMPSKEDILMGRTHFSETLSTGTDDVKNGADDIDMETFSLHRFITLAIKGEMIAMDMLHCKDSDIVESDVPEIWEWLRGIRANFYSKNLRAYVEYARKQSAKYGVKGSRINALEEALNVIKEADHSNGKRLSSIINSMPINEYSELFEDDLGNKFYDIVGRKIQTTLSLDKAEMVLSKIYNNYGVRAKLAASNEGIDWKSISHSLRAAYQAEAIFENGGFSYPLKQTDYLRRVKAGEINFVDEVQDEMYRMNDKLVLLSESSDLPIEVDGREIYETMKRYHLNVVCN